MWICFWDACHFGSITKLNNEWSPWTHVENSHFLATLSQCEYLILECLSHTRVGMSLLSIHIHAWDPPKTCRFSYYQSAQYVHFKRMWIFMFISNVQIENTLKQISSWYVEDSYKTRRIIFNVTL